jgi:hypothetical protein
MMYNVNTSSGSRADTCGQRDRQTDMKELFDAVRDFAKAPKYF